MDSHCQACGEILPIRSKRPARYCSNKCRQAAYRARRKALSGKPPVGLARQARWVRAQGKRPITVRGYPASTTQPGTWATLSQVQNSTVGDGYGVMLGGGLGCIDLDHVIDDHGRLTAVAQSILDAFPTAYVERSVSGRGLHVFGRGVEARGWRRGGVEVYSKARFIRLTGDTFRPGRWDSPLDWGKVRRLVL